MTEIWRIQHRQGLQRPVVVHIPYKTFTYHVKLQLLNIAKSMYAHFYTNKTICSKFFRFQKSITESYTFLQFCTLQAHIWHTNTDKNKLKVTYYSTCNFLSLTCPTDIAINNYDFGGPRFLPYILEQVTTENTFFFKYLLQLEFSTGLKTYLTSSVKHKKKYVCKFHPKNEPIIQLANLFHF